MQYFCLQEHWLCNKQLSELSYTYDGFVSAAVSGFDDSEVLGGRPYGGCVIFCGLINMHSVMVNTHSTRLCATRFESAFWKLLTMSVYFPVKVLHRHVLRDCQIVVYSDFNIDFCWNSLFTHSRQCACVHLLSAICDHKETEGCGR